MNSAFIGIDFRGRIDAIGSHMLLIVVLTSDYYVSTKALMAGNCCCDHYLVADAIAIFDKVGTKGERFDGELNH